MTVHLHSPILFFNTLGSHVPAMAIDSGDTVITQTLDAHGFDKNEEQRGTNPNPMTGPFFVRDAEPGDTIAIRINRISLNRSMGWTRQGLAHNVVEPERVAEMPKREKVYWSIDHAARRVMLERPSSHLKNWAVPIAPMIGCFGLAPADGEAITTASSGRHGGNMDYRGFSEGVEAMFPVAVLGGLFFLGDVHAAQGDGEIAGTGIETSAEVEFTARLIKDKPIGWPRGETADEIFTIGNARPLEQALQHATGEMLDWLMTDYGHDLVSASHVLSIAVRYDIANVFNPAFSVACRVGKSWLTGGSG